MAEHDAERFETRTKSSSAPRFRATWQAFLPPQGVVHHLGKCVSRLQSLFVGSLLTRTITEPTPTNDGAQQTSPRCWYYYHYYSSSSYYHYDFDSSASLLDSTRWLCVVFGGWQIKGVIKSLRTRIFVFGLKRSCRCLAHHGAKLLSVGENVSAICALQKRPSETVPSPEVWKDGELEDEETPAWTRETIGRV